MSCPTSSSFVPSGAVEAFHNIPHTDIDLQKSPDEFEPNSSDYWEAIVIWACVPILVCLCILILMTIYFICVCCCCCCIGSRDWSKKPKITFGIINIVIIVVLLILLGVGLWSEVGLNTEVLRSLDKGREVDDFFNQYGADSPLYTEAGQNRSLVQLSSALSQQQTPDPSSAETAVNTMQLINTELGQQFSLIDNKVGSINLDNVLDGADNFEVLRHWVVIGYIILVIVFLLVFIVAILCGICITSPIFLIIVIVVLVFITLVMWTAAGANLAFLIVSGDICNDPDRLIRNLTAEQSLPVDRDVINYFLLCNETCYKNPFAQPINASMMAFSRVSTEEDIVQTYIDSSTNATLQPLLNEVVTGFNGSMMAIEDVSTCVYLNDLYLDTLEVVCDDGYSFIVVQFGLLCGLCVGMMVLIITATCQAGLLCGTRKEYDEEALAYEFPNDSGPSAWQSYGTHQHYSSSYNSYREPANNLSGTSEPPKYNELQPVSDGNRPPSQPYNHNYDS